MTARRGSGPWPGMTLGALVMLLAGAGWWLAGSGAHSGDGAPADVAPRIAEAPALALPDAEPTSAVESLAPAPLAADAPPSDEPTDADGALLQQDLALSGRLLDPHGAPVAGALVRVLPTRAGRRAQGLAVDLLFERLDHDALPQSISGADGRFRVDARDVPPEVAAQRVAPGQFRWIEDPWVLVQHPSFATAAESCAGWQGGPHDLGDVTLRRGVTVRARLVDPDGRPLPEGVLEVTDPGSPPGGGRWNEWDKVWPLMRAVADTGGRVWSPGLWVGDNVLAASAPGHVTRGIRHAFGAPGEHDLGDVELQPSRPLSGVVLDAGGQPVPGADVVARPAAMTAMFGGEDTALRDLRVRMHNSSADLRETRQQTDAGGRFLFDGLPDVPLDVTAGLDDAEPTAAHDVRPGDPPLQLVLADPATLLVRVVDAASGEPLPGASASALRLTSRGEPPPRHGGALDMPITVIEGEQAALAAGLDPASPGLLWILPVGPLGTRLVVRAPGHARATVVLPGVPSAGHDEQRVELPEGARLVGRFVDEQGAPLADVIVRMELAVGDYFGLRPTSEGRSDGDGAFALGELFADSWQLTALAEGRATLEQTVEDLVDGHTLDLGVLELRAAGSITGWVTDGHEAPAAGVTVYASPAAGGATATGDDEWSVRNDAPPGTVSTRSDADGRFRIDDLSPGAWSLSAHPGARADATVAAGQETEAHLWLREPARVRGRVTDRDGPLEGARVAPVVARWVDEDAGASTDGSGEYELSLDAGAVTLLARHGGDWSLPVALTVDWDSEHVVDLLLADGRLAGLVLDDVSGAPIPGARVRAFLQTEPGAPRAPGGAASRQLDADALGRFAFARLPPGRWRLMASDGNHQGRSLDAIVLARDEQRDDLELRLLPGAVLAGTVRWAGEGLAFSELRVRAERVGAGSGASESRLDADGAYHLDGLPPGSWRVQVLRNRRVPPLPDQDHVFAEAEVELTIEAPTTRDLLAVPMDG